MAILSTEGYTLVILSSERFTLSERSAFLSSERYTQVLVLLVCLRFSCFGGAFWSVQPSGSFCLQAKSTFTFVHRPDSTPLQFGRLPRVRSFLLYAFFIAVFCVLATINSIVIFIRVFTSSVRCKRCLGLGSVFVCFISSAYVTIKFF